MIPLAEPTLSGNEGRYLQECIDSGYVSSVGPFVERFERGFAAVVGSRHAIACASGTAALHVALRLAGAHVGRMVAVSDFTFIASANAVAYTGADLLLVDSEPRTWNMNTELLRDEVVRRAHHGRPIPDIIEVVHVLGHPVDMEPLLELRDSYWIEIVEDAAESLGASWTAGELAGSQVGTAGKLGCFSFNGNKLITSGGGGMITTDDDAMAAEARHLINQAKMAGPGYIHDTVGYNYRLSNLAAAIGTAQVECLAERLRAKWAIAARYAEALRWLPLTLAPHAEWAHPSYWLYSVLIDDAGIDPDGVVEAARSDGVQLRRLWPPLHRQRPYRRVDRIGGEIADDIYRRGVSLPSSAHLSEGDQKAVTASLAAHIGSSRGHRDTA
ncbi:DegT/DnrJ/EryC1/StrS family aminotransferase [Phytoactinopolyspora mesophila]|uniref:DegT/DnrJ/EryC1/StrS aminotransferase n=1 Tax=Phytoactinopolyspora mesophila TaxID=2650750 RepID=A0A7K3M020_9ACTN|nr:DegT/DnrJ/EryC1/StrS family aminotransferase [Phytoactinopolyspora mesophila]NDL56641.1 DegT/DnrJ/EryC1/StrS aminotransferase [Phytoactinopolyspora mesophila]